MNCNQSEKIVQKMKRVAIILPTEDKEDHLKEGLLVAEAIQRRSQEASEEVEVIFGHLDVPSFYDDVDFTKLPSSIKKRSYNWKVIDRQTANLALLFSNNDSKLVDSHYQIPDDGINYFMDCHLLVLVTDHILYPLLPLIPYVIVASKKVIHQGDQESICYWSLIRHFL